MKKITVLLVVVMMLASSMLVSAANWVDGTYEAWSDAGARSTNYVKVFIEDGEINGVIIEEYTNKHVMKNWETYSWTQARDAVQALPGMFVEAQSADVDVITEATSTSVGAAQAVERALMKAEPDAAEKYGQYLDGVYLGRSPVGARGYYEVVWVTLEDDQVVDMKIERVLRDYSILDPADYNWPLEAARASYASDATEQTPGHVDIVTGATGSYIMWNQAVRDALDKAAVQ